MSNKTAQYLAKVEKTLKPRGSTIEDFKQNPWVLAYHSKKYERYLVNQYKDGRDFKWWNRPTDLYVEAHNFALEYNQHEYINDVMKGDPKMQDLYRNSEVDATKEPSEAEIPPDEIMDSTKPIPPKSVDQPQGNNIFFFLYRHPK